MSEDACLGTKQHLPYTKYPGPGMIDIAGQPLLSCLGQECVLCTDQTKGELDNQRDHFNMKHVGKGEEHASDDQQG